MPSDYTLQKPYTAFCPFGDPSQFLRVVLLSTQRRGASFSCQGIVEQRVIPAVILQGARPGRSMRPRVAQQVQHIDARKQMEDTNWAVWTHSPKS